MGNDFVEKCGVQKNVPDEKMMISAGNGVSYFQTSLVRHEGFFMVIGNMIYRNLMPPKIF